MFGEAFKVIEFYPQYEVSNRGRVRNIKTGRLMSLFRNSNNGWYYVCLTKDGKQTTIPVQRLVADAFLREPRDPNCSILHRDGDRSNNSVDNLVYKPRWFAVMYMRQMRHPGSHIPYPLRAEKTGEVFQTVAEFASKALVLPYDVLENLGDTHYKGYGRLSRV